MTPVVAFRPPVLVSGAKSPAITKLLKLCYDYRVKFSTFGLLSVQLGRKLLHFFLEWFVLFLLYLSSHIATRRKDVTVLSDLINACRFAKAWEVCMSVRTFVPAPGMIRASDLRDLGIA
jgi:hypothetical protein